MSNHPRQPILVSDGFRCFNLRVASAQIDQTIAHVQSEALSYMKAWLTDWKPSSNSIVVQRSTEMVHGARDADKHLAGRGLIPSLQPLDAKPVNAWS